MSCAPALLSARLFLFNSPADNFPSVPALLSAAGFSHWCAASVQSKSDVCSALVQWFEFEPDLLIVDLSTSKAHGWQLLHLLQSTAGQISIPVIALVGSDGAALRLKALHAGASEVISRARLESELALRVGNLLKIRYAFHDTNAQNRALFEELIDRAEELERYQVELKKAQWEVIARLAHAGEQHDDVTGKHTQRVAQTSRLLAQGLDLPAETVDLIGRAAPLHDVGKIGVPDPILRKAGSLTDAEWEVMKNHCRIGSQLLAGGSSEVVQMAECIALTHHERWNGEGYPRALSGANIPIEGRILAVADVFDALTHQRPYKSAWSIEDALQEIRRGAGAHFDPQIVEIFLELPHETLV